MDWNALRAEFPRAAVSWRAQRLTKEGDKAMALAYIDARDVMERLDLVCGPANWQDAYCETAKGRLLCTLALRVNGEWIAKSDGSGDSDIEGEKGAISGALKRAAVRWGVGRYLYEMPSPWVPCETFNGKWKKWTDDPWKYVRNAPDISALPDEADIAAAAKRETDAVDRCVARFDAAPTLAELAIQWKATPPAIQNIAAVIAAKDKRKAALTDDTPFGVAAE